MCLTVSILEVGLSVLFEIFDCLTCLVQIFVRNVHFVNTRFSWGKVLILGACCKTSITVEKFSPFETRYGFVINH